MKNIDRTLRFINDNINNNYKNKKGKCEKKLFKLRKWDRSIEQKIKQIHKDLENDPHEFYTCF